MSGKYRNKAKKYAKYTYQTKRRYFFPEDVCLDVMSSLKRNGHKYMSMKAVCSDGVIRKVHLKSHQSGYFLEGYVVMHIHFKVRGFVDTTKIANQFTNAGAVFFVHPDAINKDLLPWWQIPAWTM